METPTPLVCPPQIYNRSLSAGAILQPEPVFVNVYGTDSKESKPPAYVAWRGPVRQKGFSYRLARLRIDFWAP